MGYNAALLIIDMQVYFASMAQNFNNIPKIKSLIELAHARAPSASTSTSTSTIKTIFTQHGHKPSDLRPNSKNQLVKKWGISGSIHYGSPEWELIPSLAKLYQPELGDITIDKNTYDAFINSPLEQILRDEDIQGVIITGVMTNCCVETTARSAFCRGFDTWVVEDACATDSKGMHEASLRGLRFAFGPVVKMEEMRRRIEEDDWEVEMEEE